MAGPVSSSSTASRAPYGLAAVLLLIGCFLGCRLPIAAEYFNYHYDEHFYTDGAFEMLADGDYLTPHYADGELRFNKPPPTYWLVAASFKLFGASVLASRLPFLLIGCLTLLLTWLLARALLDEPSAAAAAAVVLAPLMVATNVIFLNHSGFAITDGLLTLAVTLAHYGFARILLKNERTPTTLACAYLGTGLACATKGLPGALPVPFAFAFGLWLFSRSERRRANVFPRELLSVPAMAAGLAVGASWLMLESYRHGAEFWNGFLYDQALRRFERSQWLTNVISYPASLLLVFLPWTLPLLLLFTRHRAALLEHVRARRQFYGYLLGACALEYIFYMPVNINRPRYLMPIYPLAASALADWLGAAARVANVEQLWRGLAWLVAALAVALSGLLLVYREQIGVRAVPSGVLLAGGAVVLVRSLVQLKQRQGQFDKLTAGVTAALGLGLFYIFALSVIDYVEGPLFSPAPAASVAQALRQNGVEQAELALGPEVMRELGAQLRVLSAGKWTYQYLRKNTPEQPPVVLMKETAFPALDFARYPRRIEVGWGYYRYLGTDAGINEGRSNDHLLFLLSLLSGDYNSFLARHRRKYFLTFRENGAETTSQPHVNELEERNAPRKSQQSS